MRLTSSVMGVGRRFVAMAVVAAMLMPSEAFAGGRPRKVANGPDAAATLAQWSRVQQVPVPEDIYLTTDSAPERVMLLAADDEGITVLATDASSLPRSVVRALRGMVEDKPTFLTHPDATRVVTRGDVEFRPAGIFLKGEWITDLSAVVRIVPREEVRSIQGKVSVRGNAALAALGVIGGLTFGRTAAGAIADSVSNGEELGAYLVAYGVWFAIGVGGGALLGSAGTHPIKGAIYQRLDAPNQPAR